MGDNEDAHRRGLLGRRGPDRRRTWVRRPEKDGAVEDRFRRTPTWRAKCRITGSGRPLRFELWGARGDSALYLSVSQGSKLPKEQHEEHRVYTSYGHRCGVIPYSSFVGGWIASWAYDGDDQYKREQP